MNISEKDRVFIKNLRKKHRFLKGISENDIVELFLDRCESCFELCFSDELVPIMNFIGTVYKCCEKCQKTVLDDMFYSREDYELQYIEDHYYEKL